MRINELEIKDFKAFYGSCLIDLHAGGQNLLVYGENGTGKSSLALALKLFLESGVKHHEFTHYKNVFVEDNSGYVKIKLGHNPYEWSSTVRPTDSIIIDASKTKGFIDYKGLLETYFIQREQDRVNIFDLLVTNIIADTVNDITQKTFSADWQSILQNIPSRNYQSRVRILEGIIAKFNDGLTTKLSELKAKTTDVLVKFGYDVELEFDYQGISYHKDLKAIDGREVILKVTYRSQEIERHHQFLNEARLSAIALSIYFASLLLTPSSDLKVLILDDALIGLDMSNRLPVLTILKELFSDYQKFVLTYDKAWYEIVKQRTQGEPWKFIELYSQTINNIEVPIYAENKAYLIKATEFFASNDYRASAAYLRAAFEVLLKNYCNKHKLKVRYHSNPKDTKTEDFWDTLKHHTVSGAPLLTTTLKESVELYRSIIMNPLSHSQITETYRCEIENSLNVVSELQTVLAVT